MNLDLKNPLTFIDLETTGIDVIKDRIVEMTMLKVYPDGKEKIKTYKINPTIPIPIEASKIHGIYDKDVKESPTFKEVGKTVANFIKGCDLAGYNSNRFDFPLLAEEFLRADVDFDMKGRKFVDVQTIFHKMEQRTLAAAVRFYCNKELKDAHSSEADTIATYEVLKGQLDKYSSLKNDIDFLADFSTQNRSADFAGRIVYNKDGVEVFNFGKNKGVTVEEVFEKQKGYYEWMMSQDFPLYTKKVLTAIKLRMKDKKK